MNKKIVLISSFTLLIDQILKYVFSTFITNFTLIPNFISFIYAKNDGVAFSMLSGGRLFIIFASIILIMILSHMLKNETKKDKNLTCFAYGLLFGGILGNLLDRIIRGYVVDYVSLKIINYYFPVFNLADVCITIGVMLLTIKMLKTKSS